MTTPRFRLSELEMDFVSLVPAGDDPLAQVLISKVSPEVTVDKQKRPGTNKPHEFCNETPKNGETKCDECGQAPNSPMHTAKRRRTNKSEIAGGTSSTIRLNTLNPEDRMGTINKDGLDPDVLDYLEGLETEVTTLSAQVEKSEADVASKDAEIATLRKEADDNISKSEEDREKDLLAKADPAVRALIEKQNAEIKKAQDVAKAEREQRLTKEYIAKAEAMPHVAVDAKDGESSTQAFAGLLRRAADALSPEDAETLEKAFRALNTQVEKGSLFSEQGRGGEPTTISKSVDAKAEEFRKSDPSLTYEQAVVKVYEENPDLADVALNGEVA